MCTALHIVWLFVTSQAADKVKDLDKVKEVVTAIYYYFKHAPVRKANLSKIQDMLNAPQLHFKDVHEVRWFAFYDALQTLYQSWEPLAVHLEQVKDDKGQGILKWLKHFSFLAVLNMLMDVIPLLTQFNLVFQKEDLDLGSISPAV